VVIVTGSNTGLGKEIAQILFSKNAIVYMMARSESKTMDAIKAIREVVPGSQGSLHFIRLDLSDLSSIKSSVDTFLGQESKLHVLYNNAGVGFPEKGSKTKQGYELCFGVNCLGPFLLTRLLMPTLVSTAEGSIPGSIRIVWVSSSAAESLSPENYVARISRLDEMSQLDQYSFSKLGNYLQGVECAARHKADNVLSVSLNPGALDSEFWRTQGSLMTWLLRVTVLHPPVFGAYTNLFAGFSSEVTLDRSGSYSKCIVRSYPMNLNDQG
jgi:NAD(P)-dependent dehydrogenase (short-subunit alcohol dehydrogenase family)